MALKDIEDKIISDANLEAERLISEAKAKAEEIAGAAEKEASAYLAEEKKNAELETEKKIVQAVSLARLSGRDRILSLKWQFINNVYKASLEELGKAPVKDYEYVIEKILKLIGRVPSRASVILPKGKEKKTEEALKKAVNKLKLKIDIEYPKKTFDGAGGFVLEAKNMRIDGTFESFLGGLKKELEAEVVNILFTLK